MMNESDKNKYKFKELLNQFSEEDINDIEKLLPENTFNNLNSLKKRHTIFTLINVINGITFITHSSMTKEQAIQETIIRFEKSIGCDAINKLKELYLKHKDIIDNFNEGVFYDKL